MWDLPRPGIEPVSLALAGRLLTTAPPGKALFLHNYQHTMAGLQPRMWSQIREWVYDSLLHHRITKRRPSLLKKDISLQKTAPALEFLSRPVGGGKFSAHSLWGPAALLISVGSLCDHRIPVKGFPTHSQLPLEISNPSPLESVLCMSEQVSCL